MKLQQHGTPPGNVLKDIRGRWRADAAAVVGLQSRWGAPFVEVGLV